VILPSINNTPKNFYSNPEDKKINMSNYFNISKVEDTEFDKTFLLNKKLDSLHKEIDILKIFDSFKNIVNLSSINEVKSKFKDSNIYNRKENKTSNIDFNNINNLSILYNAFPKIPNIDSSHRRIKDTELSSSNWSPLDLHDPRQTKKTSTRSPRKLKGFSVNNRKINFSKSDSIFITNNNNTAEKTFVTNQVQKSTITIDKEDNPSYKRHREKITSSNINFDHSKNQSSYFGIET